jgi:hypothetical protein
LPPMNTPEFLMLRGSAMTFSLVAVSSGLAGLG